MSERYSRLFTLPENLYYNDAPIMIAAGALLKDNQAGKILAQIKMRSISPKIIKAVKVRVSTTDTFGKELEETEHAYLDLKIGRNAEFGQKEAVYLSDESARSFTASCAEVVFSDGTHWTASENTEWTSLPKQKTLDEVFSQDLVSQYKRDVVRDAKYISAEYADLWLCTCGGINHADEKICYLCGCEKEKQFAFLNEDVLKESKRIYEAAEAEKRAIREAEEEKRRAKYEEEKRILAEKTKAEQIAAAKKRRRKMVIFLSAAVLITVAVIVIRNTMQNKNYNAAMALMESGKYEDAIAGFEALGEYKDSADKMEECENMLLELTYEAADALEKKGETAAAAIAFGKLGDYSDARLRSMALWENITERKTIACGTYHTVGIKSDGTVVAVGDNDYGQCNLSDWSDIVAVFADRCLTVGLRSDGTVVATGFYKEQSEYSEEEEAAEHSVGEAGSYSSFEELSDWSDIVAVSLGEYNIAGLRMDGTVVVAGQDDYGQCGLVALSSDWTDIVDVSVENGRTVGLRLDGTVVAVGNNEYGECEVYDWTGIIAISTGINRTVGLRRDGTVVATGNNDYGECDVSDWTDIIDISASTNGGYTVGLDCTVGLRSDGTVVSVGGVHEGRWFDGDEWKVPDWKNIESIYVGNSILAGLKKDGTVALASKYSVDEVKSNISRWRNIIDICVGDYHIVGIDENGTVVAAGKEGSLANQGQSEVSGWTDMKLP